MEYVPQLAHKLMENDDIQKPMNFPLLLGWGQLYKERLARKYKADTEDYIHVLENLKEVGFLNLFFLFLVLDLICFSSLFFSFPEFIDSFNLLHVLLFF